MATSCPRNLGRVSALGVFACAQRERGVAGRPGMIPLRKYLVELSLEERLEVVGARCNDFAHHGKPVLVFALFILAERANHQVE